MTNNPSITMLDINTIIPNKYQPRKIFDENALNSLAESIKQYGIINPILVRQKEDKYEIIAGERRYRAAKKIGLTQVPVIIKTADEQEMSELALIENIQRQELSPIEEAKSYEEIIRIGNQTQESLAKKIGKSQASIANKIRLLSLPQEVQDALANKKISERHARSLLKLDSREKQIELLNRIIKEKLTVKETEQIINSKELDEDEIKQAISDIMKSLNIKEEEKEDDNMNNGNFFPNFDNNNTMNNNNASLNMMNMQSMNQPPMEPVPEVVMPTANNQTNQEPTMPTPTTPAPEPINNQPEPLNNPVNNTFNPMAGFMNQPMNSNQPPIEQPSFQTINPFPESTNSTSPINNDSPLFGPAPVDNTQINQPEPSVPNQMEATAPMVDVPLFNPNAIIPPVEPNNNIPPINPQSTNLTNEPNQNSFEVPVVNAPIETPSVTPNKLTTLKEFLNSNGYNFKTYNNETDDCIIIEIPKN